MRPRVVRLLGAVLAVMLLTGCSEDDAADVPEPEGSWTRGADMPLSPRTSPQVGWTGSEVLVVGGDTAVVPDDMGGGPGDPVADGAAYDPAADTWRPIAEAPEPIPYYFRSAMAGDVMVVQTIDDESRASGWLAYDASEDAWRRLPDPPQPVEDTGFLSAAAGRIAARTRRGDVLELDLASGTWTAVPPDPITPGLRDVGVTATEVGTFVCGTVGRSDGQEPDLVVVDRWDGSAWARFDGSYQVGCPRHWTGTHLVNADIQTATGLDGNPPFGGRLDPATGEWTPLPDAPDVEDPRPASVTVNAAAGPLVVGWGYAYDDADGTWTPHGRPDSPVDRGTGATWADGRLVMVGGRDEEAGYEGAAGLSDETWIWSPQLSRRARP